MKMYAATAYKQRTNRAKSYVVNNVLEATPEKLIMKIYDFAILKCKARDLEKTNAALNELIYALNYDTEEVGEISIGLLKLYKFCQEQMRKRNYDIVEKILTDLRDTWADMLKQQGKL
jgi:flagellar protein FliS